MPGNIRNPITDIELIRDNLRDRYGSGFPILKELLQNGDDAGASRMDLSWHAGLWYQGWDRGRRCGHRGKT